MSANDRTKWDSKYRDMAQINMEPSPLIMAQAHHIPTSGRALDLAGGQGNHAIWLANHGLDVTLADISQVALDHASHEAAQQNLALETCCIDLEEAPFPPGPWDLILSHLYLHRPLFSIITRQLAPHGVLVCVQPTQSNLQRNARPPARYLLEDGELPSLVGELEVLFYDEGWTKTGRHDATIVAIKNPAKWSGTDPVAT